MKESNTAVSISEGPDESLGSVSLLAFLLEESTPEVYRDPVNAMYGSEPLRNKQSLDDIYNVESADGDLLKIKKSGRDFKISKSFDICFFRLIGAALVATNYSTIPDIDLRGGQHTPYGRMNASIPLTRPHSLLSDEETDNPHGYERVPPQQIKAIHSFWAELDPDFELIREIKPYMSGNIADSILDFDVISEAIDAGELTTRADSIENISPRLEAIEAIDAIKSPELLDKFLSRYCGIFGMESSVRKDIRLNFTNDTNYSNLVPSGLANPLIESLLAKLFTLTPDDCERNSDLTWYSQSDSHLYDLYLQKEPPEEQNLRMFAEESSPISFKEYNSFFEDDPLPSEDDQIDAIINSLPDRIPLPPALIIAAACNARKSLNVSYAEITTIESIANNSAAWIGDESIIDTIHVVYDTAGKIARKRYCKFNDQVDYSTDEYLTSRLPVDSDLAKSMINVSEITDEEANLQVDSITPGMVKNSLRVGPGYIGVSLSDPAELVSEYILSHSTRTR